MGGDRGTGWGGGWGGGVGQVKKGGVWGGPWKKGGPPNVGGGFLFLGEVTRGGVCVYVGYFGVLVLFGVGGGVLQ